jgi:PST family polysaccharide transporter
MGDILKLGSWVLGFVLISKAQTKLFIIIEILFSASWIILTIVFTKIFGVEGVSIAFASNYLIYWITLYFIYSRFISKNE